jgi:Uma2 family endonuclease
LGVVFADGVWLTNDDANLSTAPDAAFARWEILNSGRVSIVTTEEETDGVELRGSPDWVLEVVSRNSKRKDTRLLPAAYHRAGVLEYWLVDALGDELSFIIFLREETGFVAAVSQDGWHSSRVFGREFRLDRDRATGWRYTLSVR